MTTISMQRDELAKRIAETNLTSLSDIELELLGIEANELCERLRYLAEVSGGGFFTSPIEREWFTTSEPLRREIASRYVIRQRQKAAEEQKRQEIDRLVKALKFRPKNPILADVDAMKDAGLNEDDKVLKYETGWRLIREQAWNGARFSLEEFNLYDWKWQNYRTDKRNTLLDRWRQEIADVDCKLSQIHIDSSTKDINDDMIRLGVNR